MPIRSIKDPKYKGVSELYRKSDGKTTGYYITYRDFEGKPVKKRVEAENRDEALEMLHRVREEIERRKKGVEMSVAPIVENNAKNLEEKSTEAMAVLHSPSSSASNRGKDFRQEISSWKGTGVVIMMEVVAFEDIAICYGYEKSETIVKKLGAILEDQINDWEKKRNERSNLPLNGDWRLYPVHADHYCLHIRKNLSPRTVDNIVDLLSRRVAAHPFNVGEGLPIHINLCIGATKAEGERGLLYARKALKEARSTADRYIYYDARTLKEEEKHFGTLYETLVRNIKQKGVEPYYQGIYTTEECRDGGSRPGKYESLMRISDETGLPLSPSLFLERSREYGLYARLMTQMIDKVFDRLDEEETLQLTINFSYQDFSNPELFGYLEERIRRSGVGHRLTVEILESEAIEDFELLSEKIYRLKHLGVRVAIDDFGSGFANFDTVAALEIDYVKIDGSLISRISDPRYRTILENMVAICHDLGIETVAEFVSDEATQALVREIGIDYLQGYHLHRPEPWEKIAAKGGCDV